MPCDDKLGEILFAAFRKNFIRKNLDETWFSKRSTIHSWHRGCGLKRRSTWRATKGREEEGGVQHFCFSCPQNSLGLLSGGLACRRNGRCVVTSFTLPLILTRYQFNFWRRTTWEQRRNSLDIGREKHNEKLVGAFSPEFINY